MNVGGMLDGQWKASDEFNKIIGAYSYDVLSVLGSPDMPMKLDAKALEQIIDDYRLQLKRIYFIHISKRNSFGTWSSGIWYIYPIIEDKNIDIDYRDLIPEKKSYF
jgi:hypothetical protein